MNESSKEKHALLVRLAAISKRALNRENGDFFLYPISPAFYEIWKETCLKLQADANAPISFSRKDKAIFRANEDGMRAGYAFLRYYHQSRKEGIENSTVKEVIKERKRLEKSGNGNFLSSMIKRLRQH